MSGFDIHLAYAGMIVLGFALVLAVRVTRDLRDASERRQYYLLQAITLAGALLGAKLAVLIGDAGWPLRPYHDWEQLLWSGRSITGALLFGFVAAEAAKPLLRYPLPPNDRFATALPFSIAIGRIGCLLGGCCLGIPYDGALAIRAADGVLRHPAPLYEMAFNLAVGVLFVVLLKKRVLFGRLFALYLVLYGTFRFFIEYVRDTPKLFDGYSGYQAMSLAMVALGAAFLVKRTLAPPAWARREGAIA
jgi:phosphatidylglycerol:prolipoprotein diacylglycerol transferase